MTAIPPALPDPALPGYQPPSLDDATGGASFADLLAQMLGGSDQARTIDAGDARVAHFGGAEMFDEDGLFRGAPWGGPAIAPRDTLAPGPEPQPAPDVAMTPSLAPAAGLHGPDPSVGVILPQDQGVGLASSSMEAATQDPVSLPAGAQPTGSVRVLVQPLARVALPPPSAPIVPLQDAPVPLLEPVQISEDGHALAPLIRPAMAAPRAALSPTQLALQVGASGLHVAARIDPASHGEKLRLRDRIVAALARHGFAVGRVRVAAPEGPSSTLQEKDR